MLRETRSMRCVLWFVFAVVSFACTAPNPASCADGACTDPSLPFCDVDGSIAGIPDTCVAVTCEPLAFETCRGDQAIVCNATGMNFDLVQCELGCDPAVGGCRTSCIDDSSCALDEPVCREGSCSVCTDNDECATRLETPLCDPAGACVQCISNTDCGAQSPVCDAGTCRTCVNDADCDSGACDDATGMCVLEEDIMYFSATSTNFNGQCTRSDPCGDLARISTLGADPRAHVVLAPGGYLGALAFTRPLFFHGHGAVVSHRAPNDPNATRPILGLRGGLVRDLSFSGTAPNFGVLVDGLCRFENVAISGSKALLVRSQAKLVAKTLRIAGSVDPTAAILVESAGELTIDGGEIRGGKAAIVETGSATVHLKNLLIAKTQNRALELAQSTGEVESSTIVDSGLNAPTAPCAVACNAGLTIVSSIIVQERCQGGLVRDAVGACTFATSIVSNASPPPGTTNDDPKFIDRVGGDYHIRDTSPAKDAVDTGPAFDFEGDARPRGLKFDIGADETP
jgi:hypothetical protein